MEVTALTLKALRSSTKPLLAATTTSNTSIRDMHRSFKGPRRGHKISNSNNKNRQLLSTSHAVLAAPQRPEVVERPRGGLSSMPVFKRAALFRKNVALCDTDGCFIYEDIYHRSVKLAVTLQDAFSASKRSAKSGRRAALMCPNGASFLVAQWACWMSGAAAVPLLARGKMTEEQLEHCINDAGCEVVVATEPQVDRVFQICKKSGQILIPLERSWWTTPRKESDFNFQIPLPEMPGGMEERFSMDQPALVLYGHDSQPGRIRKVELTHGNVTHQSDSVCRAWDLNESCSVLNALPLNTSYGVCTATAAPMAVGGKVVMLSLFDPTNVWALLLGIGVNDEDKPWPKVNLLPSVPWHYKPLLQRYAESFSGPKEKEFVRYKLRQRMRAFVSSLEPLDAETKTGWASATGFAVKECYTRLEAGTVLSETGVGGEARPKKAEDKVVMEPLPGVSTRIVRYLGEKNIKQEILDQNGTSAKPCTGQLVIRSPGVGRVIDGNRTVQNGSWLNTQDTARMAEGKFQILTASSDT